MRKTHLLYWLPTGLLAALMLLSGISNALVVPEAIEGFRHLGYPVYLLPFLGVAKVLGVVAILVPGFPRIREWAYAGFVFDVGGAMYSLICVGEPVTVWLPIVLVLLLIAASYYFNRRRAEATPPPFTAPSIA